MTGTRKKKEKRYVCKNCGYYYFNRLPMKCEICEGTVFRVDERFEVQLPAYVTSKFPTLKDMEDWT